jgi:hypothetical protein
VNGLDFTGSGPPVVVARGYRLWEISVLKMDCFAGVVSPRFLGGMGIGLVSGGRRSAMTPQAP